MILTSDIVNSIQDYIWETDNDLTQDKYTLNDTFDSLGLDSMELVKIIQCLEIEYNIDISNSEIGKLKAVRDLVFLVEGKCQMN